MQGKEIYEDLEIMADSEFTKQIISGEVSDNEFLAKFLDDVESLGKLGFPPLTAVKMMGKSLYVRAWAKKPSVAVMAKKLPKGYKWSMGKKYVEKRWKKGEGYAYVILAVENDVYIKGEYLAGCHKLDPKIIKITNFRKYTANEIIVELMKSSRKGYTIAPLEADMIREFWHDNGLSQGFIENCLN